MRALDSPWVHYIIGKKVERRRSTPSRRSSHLPLRVKRIKRAHLKCSFYENNYSSSKMLRFSAARAVPVPTNMSIFEDE